MASLKSTSSDIRSMTRCAFERLVPPQRRTTTSSFVRLPRGKSECRLGDKDILLEHRLRQAGELLVGLAQISNEIGVRAA